MARQFQGYARGRGFSSRNPGSAAVSRIQEQGNKTISGLREQLQSKRQKDQQYIADLDSNFRRGEQIKDEIKSFEDKAFNLKMANVKRNQNQHLENIKTEAQNQADKYKQLSEFSQTLGQTAFNVGTQIQKAQDEAASTVNKISGANRSTYADQAVAEELEKNDIANENKLAKVATENGLPEHTRQEQRASSPNRQVKGKKAAVAEAWNQYSTRATYNNYGPDLAHKIFKELGLLDSNDRLFTEFADKYEQLNLAFKTTNSRTRAVNQSNELDTKATAQFFNNPTSETLFHAWQTHKAGTDDGRGPRNNKAATDYLFGTLLTSLNLSDEQVLDLLQNTNLRDENGNKLEDTFYSRFENTRVQKLLIDRRDSSVKSVTDREKVVKAEQLDNYLKTRDEIIKIGDQGNIDFETYKPMLDDLDVSNDQRNKLHEELYAISNQKVSNDALIVQADYLLSIGQDISQVIRGMTGKARSKYMDLNNKQMVAKTEAGMDEKTIRRTVKSALIKALGQQNVGDDKDPTLELALEDAMVDIGRDTVTNASGAADFRAWKPALQLKLDEIKSKTGKYEVKGIGRGNSNATSNYFSYYSTDGKYFEQVATANASEAIRAVRNRPDSRKDVFLVLTDDLATIYNAVQNNEGYQLPYALKELQKAYPDTVQLQLNKYADEFGRPRITVPLTYQQVLSARQEDKRAQRFMQQVETIQEERIIPLIADASTRMSDMFMAPNVGQRVASIRVRKPYEQLLSTIRSGEGSWTSANRGTAGDTPYGVPGLDRMTVSQWKDLQKNQGYFALGAYQFIPSTFAGAVKRAGFSEDTVMTPDNQDLLAIELIEGGTKRPVLSSYLNGTSDDVYAAAEDLAKEWAAVKTSKGTSAYEGIAGNSGSISQDRIVQLLMQIREMKQRG